MARENAVLTSVRIRLSRIQRHSAKQRNGARVSHSLSDCLLYTSQIQRDSGDESYQALCLNNIGGVYFTNGQYDDALTYFQQALELREKLKVQGEIAETTYNLAETESRLGQYDQALSQYHRALDLFRSTDDKRNAAIDSYSMGTLFGLSLIHI